MKGFDVLYEPWIPVIRLNGERDCLGIIPTLEEAHELREVLCNDPLETYAVQRLLIAFLMDAYWSADRLKTVSDRRSLYQQSRFDSDVLKSYVDMCRAEGDSFDLFDKERPFMQSTFDCEKNDLKPVDASQLFLSIPSGNNHVHFYHPDDAGKSSFLPDECLRALLALYCFTPLGGRGYSGSITGSTCYYFLICGNTLFETLVFSMLAQKECPSTGTSLVQWREQNRVGLGEALVSTSILQAFTWIPRRVLFRREADNSIKSIYFKPGRKLGDTTGTGEKIPVSQLWKDPHVAYFMCKKGYEIPLQPEWGRMLWRDVALLSAESATDRQFSQPHIVKQYKKVFLNQSVCRLECFGISGDGQAKIFSLMHDHLFLPSCIIEDVEKAERLRKDIRFIDECAVCLKTYLLRMEHQIGEQGKLDSKIKRSELTDEAQARFFSRMQPYITGEYFALLDTADTSTEWEDPIVSSVNKTVKKCVLDTLNDSKRMLGTTARQLQAQAGNERALMAALNKKMKERGAYE